VTRPDPARQLPDRPAVRARTAPAASRASTRPAALPARPRASSAGSRDRPHEGGTIPAATRRGAPPHGGVRERRSGQVLRQRNLDRSPPAGPEEVVDQVARRHLDESGEMVGKAHRPARRASRQTRTISCARSSRRHDRGCAPRSSGGRAGGIAGRNSSSADRSRLAMSRTRSASGRGALPAFMAGLPHSSCPERYGSASRRPGNICHTERSDRHVRTRAFREAWRLHQGPRKEGRHGLEQGRSSPRRRRDGRCVRCRARRGTGDDGRRPAGGSPRRQDRRRGDVPGYCASCHGTQGRGEGCLAGS